MRKLLWILPLLLLLASCNNYRASRGPADWIYVDQAGSDVTGDGTPGAPYATVSHACTHASSGDTVYVNPGTINESAQIVKPLGVSIYGAGATSIINSSFASNYTGSINCASTVGNPVNDGGSISHIRLTGNNYTGRIGIYGAYRNNVSVHHCTIDDFIYGAIRIRSNNANVFTRPTVGYATGWSIHDNAISDCGYLNSSYASVWFDGTDGMQIYNNTFVDTARAAGSNSWATIKCTFNTGYDIYDNTFYREDHEAGRFNFFLENWNYEGDCQFRDNTLYGLANVDFGGMNNQVSAGRTYGIRVYRNRFLNSANGNFTNGTSRTIIGITIEGNGHDEVYVYQNLIQRYGFGIEIATPKASSGGYEYNWSNRDIYIYANIISDVGYLDNQYCYGIFMLNETNTDGFTNALDNLNILNNTITAMTGSTYQGIRFSGNDTISNITISNNIIRNFDSYGIYLGEHATDGLSMTNVDVTYNCMNSNGTNTVGIDGDIVQSNFDVTTGNITSDPLFRSSGTFRLQSASPAINAGINVSLTSDFAGHRVPQQDTVDIGAYEYGDYLFRTPSGKLLRNANGKLMITH